MVGDSGVILRTNDAGAPLTSGKPSAAALPASPQFLPNYPNPFNATTTIAFTLPAATRARLALYTVEGREVAVLRDGLQPAGEHRAQLDAGALASGVYLCRLTSANFSATQKIMLLK